MQLLGLGYSLRKNGGLSAGQQEPPAAAEPETLEAAEAAAVGARERHRRAVARARRMRERARREAESCAAALASSADGAGEEETAVLARLRAASQRRQLAQLRLFREAGHLGLDDAIAELEGAQGGWEEGSTSSCTTPSGSASPTIPLYPPPRPPEPPPAVANPLVGPAAPAAPPPGSPGAGSESSSSSNSGGSWSVDTACARALHGGETLSALFTACRGGGAGTAAAAASPRPRAAGRKRRVRPSTVHPVGVQRRFAACEYLTLDQVWRRGRAMAENADGTYIVEQDDGDVSRHNFPPQFVRILPPPGCPRALFVSAPRLGGRMDGEYHLLLAESCRLWPVWACGPRRLYSEPRGAWALTAHAANVPAGGGAAFTISPHQGVMPHQAGPWMVKIGGEWVGPDDTLTVTAVESEAQHRRTRSARAPRARADSGHFSGVAGPAAPPPGEPPPPSRRSSLAELRSPAGSMRRSSVADLSSSAGSRRGSLTSTAAAQRAAWASSLPRGRDVEAILLAVGLERYAAVLSAQGYESIADLRIATADDLVAIGLKRAHMRKLLEAARRWPDCLGEGSGLSRIAFAHVPAVALSPTGRRARGV